jgi:hypothetical protein
MLNASMQKMHVNADKSFSLEAEDAAEIERSEAAAFTHGESGWKISDSGVGSGRGRRRDVRRSGGADPAEAGTLSMLWRHKLVWLPPLAGEALLLVAAVSLSLALAKTTKTQPVGAEWWWVSVACALFLVTRLLSNLGELFLPRVVAALGVGSLCLLALGLVAAPLLGLSWHEVFVRISAKSSLVSTVPLGFFVFRSIWVMRAARYSPNLGDMNYYSASSWNSAMERLKSRLEFWMR